LHLFAGKRGIPEAKPVENGSVDEVEIVNVTSMDMSPFASRLTSQGRVSYLLYSKSPRAVSSAQPLVVTPSKTDRLRSPLDIT